MSGSRSNPQGSSDRTSLDALSRTIEGLEARIEGLIGAASTRDPRSRLSPPAVPPAAEPPVAPAHTVRAYERAPMPERLQRNDRPDPFEEIRQRQRTLEANREHSLSRQRNAAPAERSGAYAAERQQQPQVPAFRQPPAADTTTEIAQALVSLRQDLKQDIAEGVAREMGALRAEIRSIKTNAEDQHFAEDLRDDMARLADSINQLAANGSQPESVELKTEFEELRSLMDGLAREDSVRVIESRWDGLEDRLRTIDTAGLQDELVSLAYRLDDIKRHLGDMSASPAVHALEEKLISMATVMEQIGTMIQPRDEGMVEQFSALDTRLDEISRAIVANGRSHSNATDPAMMQRLESRITGLADQIDLISSETLRRQQPAEDLAGRIEALTMRVEELSHSTATSKLEERLDQLSHLMERSQRTAQPELTSHLADISRKIDALDQGAVNDALAARLDRLARSIEEMEFQPAPVAAPDDVLARRLEGRLADIARRLEESTAAPPADHGALRALEDQIANLSSLMSETHAGVDSGFPAEFDRRMNAIENHMATNDEYIIEAARQAAEAVVDAYSRNGVLGGSVNAAEMSALSALADDLRHLETISRSSDERTHRTFEALHDTLVQIAGRLDHIEMHRPSPRMPAAEFSMPPVAHADEAYAQEAPLNRAGPVIRPAAAIPEQPAVRASAAVVAAEPVNVPLDEEIKAEIKAAAKQEGIKSSLFAGLGKRFRPSRKGEPAPTGERPVIDPAPSIDAAELMPPEETNELLEPGSGAPDIKRILERVRASQNAARTGTGTPASDKERADYIAAARRAAQAAAMEADQTQRMSSTSKKGAKAPKNSAKGATAFSRLRRPILLAVGAALLAIMAYPLASTLLHGKKAPAPAEISALSSAASGEGAAKTVAAPIATSPSLTVTEPLPANAVPAAATDGDVQPLAPPPAAAAVPAAADGDHLRSATPLGSNDASEVLSPAGAPAQAQETSAFVPPKDASAAQQPAAPTIAVPDTIQPPSLAEAARSGDPLALFEIAARFTDGRGVTADLKQAASWYQLSADRNFAPAQYRLASMYEKGNGIDRDLAKAKHYYELAANQGNANAMHNLAVLYASGTAGPQDYNAAADWFTKAANLGISDSQFNLAILYARGNGVKQDLAESYKWFAIAAKSGDKDAAQKRDEVANAMKPDQLSSARANVDLWKPQPADSKANAIDVPDEWNGKGVHTASIDMKKAVRNIQAILNNNGFDAGPPDGEMGGKTVAALKSFQTSIGMQPDGKVTDKVVKELLARNK